MKKVFIDGREGTTGLQLDKRLAAKKDIEVIHIPEEFRKDAAARSDYLNACDVAVLCLPDAAAEEAVSMVKNPNVKILDASTAHRTAAGWAYGLPELSHEFENNIKNMMRVSVPGCHASGFLAIVYPLIKANYLDASAVLSCTSLTGYSGGGKKMISEYENPLKRPMLETPRMYALEQQHKHLKEMQTVAAIDHAPLFMPIVCPFYSGMQVSVALHSSQLKGLNAKTAADFLGSYYNGKGKISAYPYQDASIAKDGMIAANALSGSDGMVITVSGGTERVLFTATYDNLGKGASGAALQCINLMTAI